MDHSMVWCCFADIEEVEPVPKRKAVAVGNSATAVICIVPGFAGRLLVTVRQDFGVFYSGKGHQRFQALNFINLRKRLE